MSRRNAWGFQRWPVQELLVGLVGQIHASGELGHDVRSFLARHGHPRTAEHSRRVAAEARRIALLVGADADRAEAAGWLHDVSAVVPVAERAEVAKRLGLAVLPEEEAHPLLVHQKLSALMGRGLFRVTDAAVLGAVGYHTTLKSGATDLDKVLFVADTVEWDQLGVPSNRDGMLRALESSLDGAAIRYLHALWERRDSLRVIHPWVTAAHRELCGCPAFAISGAAA